MEAIRNNIVGLLKFTWLLCLMLIPVKKRSNPIMVYSQRDKKDLPDKYQAILKHDSEPLVPIETKFCPKCHALVANIKRTKQGTQVIQNGKVLVTVGSNVISTKDNQEEKGFPINCPNGHIVRIE